MHTTSSTGFDDRVRAVMAGMDTTGLIDRFAANDVLLDLLDAAGTDEESARVRGALAPAEEQARGPVDAGRPAGQPLLQPKLKLNPATAVAEGHGDHIDTTS